MNEKIYNLTKAEDNATKLHDLHFIYFFLQKPLIYIFAFGNLSHTLCKMLKIVYALTDESTIY